MQFEDVDYEVDGQLAWITINRPHRYNSMRSRTIDELIARFESAWDDPDVAVVALTGAGDKAFCPGHDIKEAEGDPGLRSVDQLHRLIREIPKPVIAAVNGDAVGGGHVLHVLCDFTIASSSARFGQVGPRVGSFDIAWGCSVLVRVIGEKRAREMWSMCELLSADKAERWGLVNKVVAPGDLQREVRSWANTLIQRSPAALGYVKHSIALGSEPPAGFVAYDALRAYRTTDESKEGRVAFAESRAPDYQRFR